MNTLNSENLLKPKKLNNILILADQLVNYQLLPPEILDMLPGYQAFKKISIEYTKSYNNRVVCSPSRAVIISGKMDTYIQDNIQDTFQYNYVPKLPENFNTIGKLFKENEYFTRYLGKLHIYSNLYQTVSSDPFFGTCSTDAMKIYGYDVFNQIQGDSDFNQKGMLNDAVMFNFINSPNQAQGNYDYYDSENDLKLSGVIPFLRARNEDKQNFFAHINFVNPHDIKESKSDLSQVSQDALQFWRPYNNDQIDEINKTASPQIPNPYYFNELDQHSFIKNSNLITNFFENTYEKYKTNPNSIPNNESLVNDFCLDPKYNLITPYYVGFQKYIAINSTCPTTAENFKSWKNYLNNYYGLIMEFDSYLYKIYLELKKFNMLENTNIIITADHGEMAASHGQREKGLPFNSNVNIPLLLYSPLIDPIEYNTKSEYINTSIDLIPTFIQLNNFNTSSTQFTGESIIKLNSNNKFISKNITDNVKKSALHLENATEALITWFTYINWFYNISTSEEKERLNYKRLDFFNYRYAFVMNQTLYNSKHYKYGIQYSLNDLIKYNIIAKNIVLNKQDIISNFPNINPEFNTIVNILLEKYDVININNYDQVFDKISDYNNIVVLFTYMYSLIKCVDTILNRMYIIPGFNSTFSQNFENYNLFCYDLTNDPNEIINMLDKLNYNESNDNIFNYLNNELNESIKLNNLTELYVIVPYQEIILGTIEIIIEEFKKLFINIFKNNINPALINYLLVLEILLIDNNVILNVLW